MTKKPKNPIVAQGQVEHPPQKARPENFSLVEFVLSGKIRLPREHQQQRGFFRALQRAGSDRTYKETVKHFRDAVLRAYLARADQSCGMAIAMAGAQGGEGTSLLSLLLALSLGAVRNYRVAYLDGRFSNKRFEALSHLLSLSRNACRIEKGANSLDGYYNKRNPNVYFLRNASEEQGLEFFADRQLKSIIADLKQTFDFLIIDMPPVLKETSNTFIATEVDSFYLVVSSGKTRLAEIDRCREIISELGRDVSGVVLNNQKVPLWARLFWKEYFV